MGCSTTRPIVYNNYENPPSGENEADRSFLSGPFLCKTKQVFEELEKSYQDKTLIEVIMKTLEDNKDNESLGYRKQIDADHLEDHFTFFKCSEINQLAETLAKNLVNFKLASRDEETGYDFIGIFSRNSVEWALTDIACQLMSITSVTFYSTLGELAFEHICNQTLLSTIVVSPESVATLLKYKNKFGLKTVENVIIMDLTMIVKEETLKDLENAGIRVFHFSKLCKENPEAEIKLNISKPDTTLTICYTSGTTALPKGVELTQRNFIAEMTIITDSKYSIHPQSVYLSYLPLAHVFERLAMFLCLVNGAHVGFFSGDLKKHLREEIGILRPTFFVAVPRVLDTFRKMIFDEFSKLPGGCKKSLVEKAVRVKRENFRQYGTITHSLYDRLIFSKIRQRFGGRLECFIIGSAPLPSDLAEDIKILFSIPIIEGYGMTETTGGACCSYFTDLSNSSAGGCASLCKAKLVDVPEMKYNSTTTLDGEASPTGELCIYGPIVFKGYYKNEEETKKTIDSEGWLHTGDVARILPYNHGIKIIDRVKEIFKLSQGEYIAPSKLESVYLKSKYVTQICVYGNSTKNNIVGLIVPNQFNIKELVKSQGKWNEDSKVEDFYQDKEVIDAVRKDLEALALTNHFNSLEKVNSFVLLTREFTVDNGSLTPTMKFVRKKIADLYHDEIEKLYQ